MLVQHSLIDGVRRAARSDRRITAALTYGSFTQGEGDAWSDVEFFLFLAPDALEGFDLGAWLDAHVAPVRLLLVNEFGTPNVVFDDLVRGEFHLESETGIGQVAHWAERRVDVDAMLLKDDRGDLRAALEQLRARGEHRTRPEDEAQTLWDQLLNWLAFGSAVLLRGERARAHELLWWVHDRLVRLARLAEGAVQHWLSEKRWLERELGAASYARYASTTAGLTDLEGAYVRAWTWARELAVVLQARLPLDSRARVASMLDARMALLQP